MISVSIFNADLINGVSKLQWQDDTVGSLVNWMGAISECKDLNLAGYSDWRLPNINELKSIIDRTKVNSMIVGVIYYGYWSATTYKGNSNSAWSVNFNGIGNMGYGSKSGKGYVRCVRDVQ